MKESRPSEKKTQILPEKEAGSPTFRLVLQGQKVVTPLPVWLAKIVLTSLAHAIKAYAESETDIAVAAIHILQKFYCAATDQAAFLAYYETVAKGATAQTPFTHSFKARYKEAITEVITLVQAAPPHLAGKAWLDPERDDTDAWRN